MMPADANITIRPSRVRVVVVAAWIGFLCLLMIVGAASEHDPRGYFLVLVWLPWLVPVMLAARARVTAANDTLTYHGSFRARSWHRSQVQGFEITTTSWSYRNGKIHMLTTDGQRVPFTITATSWRRRAQIERWHAALEGWLTVDHGSA